MPGHYKNTLLIDETDLLRAAVKQADAGEPEWDILRITLRDCESITQLISIHKLSYERHLRQFEGRW